MNRLLSQFNPIVYFDISIDGRPRGRVCLEVFENIAPLTSRNFRALANGYSSRLLKHNTISKPSYSKISMAYRNTKIHRIVPGFMIQGGDILYNNGFGITSIYGKCFIDETFVVPHNRPGILSMANSGPDTNGCQFFITTAPARHLDGKNVAFGQVVSGYDIVKEIEECGSPDGRPSSQVWITGSGELNEESYLTEVNFERIRIEENIEKRKAIDLEEVALYNACQLAGIEYVPRAVRERQHKKQKDLDKIEDAERFTREMLEQSLSEDVETLSKQVEDTKSKQPIIFTKPQVAKEILENMKLQSKDPNAERPLSNDLERFVDHMLRKSASTITPYSKHITYYLDLPYEEGKPIEPEVVLETLIELRQSSPTAKNPKYTESSGDLSTDDLTELDKNYLEVLDILYQNPKAHALSPCFDTRQTEVMHQLITEIRELTQAVPEQTDLVSPSDPLYTIKQLAQQKSALEKKLSQHLKESPQDESSILEYLPTKFIDLPKNLNKSPKDKKE